MASSDPALDTPRHSRYWQRCYKSLLPHHYTSMDSNRLLLAYFILAALDLMSSPSSFSSPPDPSLPPEKLSLIPLADRARMRAFILSHQHPHGGFCGSSHHVFPACHTTTFHFDPQDDRFNATARDPENARLSATYFALLSLAILTPGGGDAAFNGVDRTRTLRWLKTLQRKDGSFGDVVDQNGFIAGGMDMRHCYLAATIRWILGGNAPQDGTDENLDFDVDSFVAHIRRGQTYDGGIAESATHESHAGYAYCAVAALSLLDMANPDNSSEPQRYIKAGIPSIPGLVHFLVDRQHPYLEPSTDDEDSDAGNDPETSNAPLPDISTLTLEDYPVGFNGRLNKNADTCYTWWVAGTLAILDPSYTSASTPVIDRASSRAFLLSKTQHLIGGFGKYPGSPPDIYHSYLGLAALATIAEGADGPTEQGLGRLDPRLSIGVEAVGRIKNGRAVLLRAGQNRNTDVEGKKEPSGEAQDEEKQGMRATEDEAMDWSQRWRKQGKTPTIQMDRLLPGKKPIF